MPTGFSRAAKPVWQLTGRKPRCEATCRRPKSLPPESRSRRPKHDVAEELARAVFENNREALYHAYVRAALKGNGYVFKELADRGYGRLKERIEHEVRPYGEATDEELQERIQQLEIESEFGAAPIW